MQGTLEFLNQFSGEKITTATMIVLISIMLIYIVNKKLTKYFEKNENRYSSNTQEIIRLLVSGVLGFGFVVAMMSMFDVVPSGTVFLLVLLVTTIAAVGQLLGGNLSSGLFVRLKKYYKKGDYAVIGSFEGNIKDICLTNTIIKTAEGNIVHIPNSSVISDSVSVISQDDTFFQIITIPVNSEYNPNDVIKDLSDVLESIPTLLKDEDNYVGVSALKNNIVEYECDIYCRFEDRYDTAFYFNKAVLEMMHDKHYEPAKFN